ncbi:MAG: arginase family protein [Acidimicrobiia bacterium]
MTGFAIIEAPSVLGLFPGGVEELPRALLDAGLARAVGARHADLEGRRPLVLDEDVVHVARRDAAEAGSRRIEDSGITVIDLAEVRRQGAERAAGAAIEHLTRPDLVGFWVHLDCDALSDTVMPAVDYRLPGGLTWDELGTVLQTAFDSGRAVGIEVTIFNPALDRDGSITTALVSTLARGIGGRGHELGRAR